ncbi:MAG: CotH kinase family protein, partial [Planctomycetales bacterium]
FLEFENADWEAELSDFHGTDVEVPATLIVDGQHYPNVGVHFRGMSSYGMVSAGYKRSMNLALDFVDREQRLYGYKTLNLLNSHEDATFMSTVLYSHIARQHLPAPRANFARVVVNGESWGLYVNAQQFNKEFMEENFQSSQGARWKVRGSPGGGGGLEYLGDEIEPYRRRYEIKSADKNKSWRALIGLCKTLNEAPAEQLEEALAPLIDLDGLLWFLALDAALINGDGYWIRASDYCVAQDGNGKFHIIPQDMNEAFRPGMGPGFGFVPGGPGGPGRPGRDRGAGGPPGERERREPNPGAVPAVGTPPVGGLRSGGSGVEIDPLIGLDDPQKPLRSKILAVPALRTRYLKYVRQIAQNDLDWEKLGPVVAGFRDLIGKEIAADTRKLESLEAFEHTTADDATTGRGREFPLRAFADQRRRFLLNHPQISELSGKE